MASVVTVKINTGDGLVLDSGKLQINLATSSSYLNGMKIDSTGLYVPSLKGANGKPGGSKVDGISIVENNGYPDLNRDVCSLIFSVKTQSAVSGIITMMHSTTGSHSAYTPYILKSNDLLMFRDDAYPSSTYSLRDDGNRYNSNTCRALFVIKSAGYDVNWITSLKIRCIWSNVSGWTAGTTYSS